MSALAQSGITVPSLKQLAASLDRKQLTGDAAVITFDDGFQNVYEVALPVLKQFQFPATVFLVTEFCGKDNRCYGQPKNIPAMKLLNWDAIQEMFKHGVEFGVHTATHPDLSTISDQQMADEIIGSREKLHQRLGQANHAFAYPYGSAPKAAKSIVEANFYTACSTKMDFVSAQPDLHFLPRIDMYYFSKNHAFSSIGKNSFKRFVQLRKALRGLKQGFARV